MEIRIPQDVKEYVNFHFSMCNEQLAYDLAVFPGIHEESLDMNFISYFARIPGPVILQSNWMVRIDAHFIGGGRHFGTWEVADIGLMLVFRKNGQVIRSKIVFLQSKKLYANSLKYKEEDPHIRRFGLGRLIVTEEEHKDLVQNRVLTFKERSKYQAYKKGSDQQDAMGHFQERFGMKMYYLFYNPPVIPHSVRMPLEWYPSKEPNLIGCRIVPKSGLDAALTKQKDGYTPTYEDMKTLLRGEFAESPNFAGWRLEYFVSELMLGCKEGLIDESPNFEHMIRLMNQKQRPMSSALSITFDINE